MEVTTGSSEVGIGLIDGPVDTSHPDLAAQAVTNIGPNQVDSCRHMNSAACRHGSYVAGILAARRGSEAPAICPDCGLLVRPIFLEPMTNLDDLRADPAELALALADCADAGVRVVNVSAGLAQPSMKDERALTDALDHAARRDVIVVVAAGNQGTLGRPASTAPSTISPCAIPPSTPRPPTNSHETSR
jgi:subtilisin family serine protease